ncbi:CPBP family intramembrane glutamic endopeptidase [Nocardioides jensenii]|uniref:CPBP family intramembrane glutamic endopeptidase n=1 Tax=Nocardioides jensenii TaxID=1843 RepID=UPI00082BC5FF|nr:CPBP family intramembrane glutamic endopeptidase [Nocardioides jensenii]
MESHTEPGRRRLRVTVGTAALGAVLLAVSLRIEPGSAWFYPSTLALAAVWAAGAWASGPLHLGRVGAERPVLPALVVGGGLSLVFVTGALVIRELPVLADRVAAVLEYAAQGSVPLVLTVTVVNGVAEEMFFRGALYEAVPWHPVLVTAAAYALVTLVTGNPMLAFAALVLGLVVGRQRQISGGLLAPAITHVTWSVTMLYVLPWLF